MINLPGLNNQSVVVLANYRSGSTAFCDYLCKTTGVQNFDEVFHAGRDFSFYEKIKHQRFIIKIQPNQIPQQYWHELKANCFVVGLYRKSMADQISSFYLGHRTGTWHYQTDNHSTYTVDIDRLDLENQCRYLLEMNRQYLSNRHYCDVELAYEDIVQDLAISEYKIYPKPDNFDQLMSKVQEFLQTGTINE